MTAVEVVSGMYAPMPTSSNIPLPNFRIVGFFGNSSATNDFTSGIPNIGQNEAYAWLGSSNSAALSVGEVIPFNFSVANSPNGNTQYDVLVHPKSNHR